MSDNTDGLLDEAARWIRDGAAFDSAAWGQAQDQRDYYADVLDQAADTIRVLLDALAGRDATIAAAREKVRTDPTDTAGIGYLLAASPTDALAADRARVCAEVIDWVEAEWFRESTGAAMFPTREHFAPKPEGTDHA